MGQLKIHQAGLMTSIQDEGRPGLSFYAIPRSGVMDASAFMAANLLLQNPKHYPVLECTALGPTIEFLSYTQIALTGADFSWQLNGEDIPTDQMIYIKSGDLLKGGQSKKGLRGYLAIKGLLKAVNSYGSYATYVPAGLGGLEGRFLKKGDLVQWKNDQLLPSAFELHIQQIDNDFIPIYPGPEYNFLTNTAKVQLTDSVFTISKDSNRMGARLEGPRLSLMSRKLEKSVAVLPGFIQLPPSGNPIVLLNDGQTTGGYPRIAFMKQRHLAAFNQLALGQQLRFKWGKINEG